MSDPNSTTMTQGISVLERVTPDNFDAHRYVLANRDLQIAFGDDKALAERHLHEYGLKENRSQLSAAFLESRREKFSRFKASLPKCNAESFPLTFGESLHQISEYG